MCIKRHRGCRSQNLLADMVGRSMRWMAYVEAGKADLGWDDLLAITTALGPVDGRAFLNDAISLLYREADVDMTKKGLLTAIERRDFLGVLGVGAAADMERLSRALHGLGIDSVVAGEMAGLTRLYADRSRQVSPGVLIAVLQAHLRGYLELILAAPAGVSGALKAGAAEAALLTGVVAFRLGHSAESLHYWLMASGLGAESGHAVVQAYAAMIRPALTLHPAEWGGGEGADPLETLRALDHGLEILGKKPSGVAAVTFHAWRSGVKAALGDARAAELDLEAAERALSKISLTSSDDLTGLGVHNHQILAAERATSALFLGRPNEVLAILGSGMTDSHTSPGWRAARLADLAAAYSRRGDHDQAAKVLLEASKLALGAKDPWRLRRLQGIRRQWLPDNFASETLAEFDRGLASALSV
jgi:hypothetical protein